MATQILRYRYTTGQTLTAKAFDRGSDTVVQTASAVTEATNAKNFYFATFTDLPAGVYDVVYFLGSSGVGSGTYTLTLTDGTFYAWDDREPVTPADIEAAAAAAIAAYDPPTHTEATADKAEILAAVSAIDADTIAAAVVDGLDTVTITRISPYNPVDSSFRLIQDDDYIYANGAHLDISLVGEADIDLTTASAVVGATKGDDSFTGTATIVGADGATPVLRIEWPGAGSGKATGAYKWQAKVLDVSGNKKTEFAGPLVLEKATV